MSAAAGPRVGGSAREGSRFAIDPRLRSRSIGSYLDVRLHIAALSFVAGAIHAVVAVPHFDEYWLFGSLFAAVAALQLGWGVAAYRRPSRSIYRFGASMSLAIVAVWLVSRTAGLPVGPDAGAPEAVGAVDAVCGAIELAIAGLCIARLRPSRPLPAPLWVIRPLVLALMWSGLLLLLVGAGHQH